MTLLASITILSAVAIRAAAQDSRTAAASPAATRPLARAHAPSGRAPVREHCPQTQHAIRHYRNAYTTARTTMGLAGAPPRHWYPCPAARRRAIEWRERAKQARIDLARWKRDQWAAPPEPFLSIARCENRGTGLYGVNWDAHNSVYEGAYGFLHSTWDQFKPSGYPDSASTATIAQQTQVARILVATFGGYSSWPACHRRLGLPG